MLQGTGMCPTTLQYTAYLAGPAGHPQTESSCHPPLAQGPPIYSSFDLSIYPLS